MDLKDLDDTSLALAKKAAEDNYEKDHTLDNFKIVAKYRYESNLRRYRESKNKIPIE